MATVDTLIEDARGFATASLSDAQGALQSLQSQVNGIGWTVVQPGGLTLPQGPTVPQLPDIPVLDKVAMDLPAEPEPLTAFQDISPIEVEAAPTLTASAPTLVLPALPAAVAAFTDAAPTLDTAIVFPDVPAQLQDPQIAAPELTERAAPVRPDTALPSFTAVAPVDDTQAPTNLAGQFRADYGDLSVSMRNALDGHVDAWMERLDPGAKTRFAQVEDKLQQLFDGKLGIPDAVADAITESHKDKHLGEARRVQEAAWEDAARRGYTLPSGMLLAGLQRARQGASDNLARGNVELTIKRFEWDRDNLKLVIDTSVRLRESLVSAAAAYLQSQIAINGQALDASRALAGLLVEAYNASVRAFEVRLQAYQAEAAVFDTRLKAAMAGIQLYQAEIQALQALTEVDLAKVRVYQARIDGLQALAQVYRARIDSVQGRAGLEKLKIELFQARVQGYQASVQAKNSEFDAFRAAIQGEEAKAALFTQQVQAYGAQVQGFRGLVDARAESVRAQVSVNQARADAYRAAMGGYSSLVQAKGEVARTQLENQRQNVTAFEVAARAIESTARMHSDYYRTNAEVRLKHYATDIEAMLKTADQQFVRARSAADIALSTARVYEGIGNAALSGMNTLVSQQLVQ